MFRSLDEGVVPSGKSHSTRTSDPLSEPLIFARSSEFVQKSELLTPIRTSDVRLEMLALRGNQNFGPPVRTSYVRLEVLALRENQNF